MGQIDESERTDRSEPYAATASGAAPVIMSNAPRDNAVADAACQALQRAGVACSIAPLDMVRLSPHADGIVRAIAGRRVYALVFSGRAVASPHVGT